MSWTQVFQSNPIKRVLDMHEMQLLYNAFRVRRGLHHRLGACWNCCTEPLGEHLMWTKCFENPLSKGEVELRAAGFTVHKSHNARWFEVTAPQGKAPTAHRYVMLRMRTGIWHSFGEERATGSGGDPSHALYGGLGDVVESNSELRAYCRAIMSAPSGLSRKYDGLSAAQSACYNEGYR